MNPTPRLRFVERNTGAYEMYDVKVTERHGTEVCYKQRTIRVLQQWHEYDTKYPTEDGCWIDVPMGYEDER